MYAEKAASSKNYTTVSANGFESWWENSGMIHNGWPTMRSPSFIHGGFIADNQETSFFGDGSTHSLSLNLPLDQIYQIGHRSDGTVVDVTDL